MSKPMKQYCTKIVWRCAVVFIICTCLITCIHNRFVAASDKQATLVSCENTADGTAEKGMTNEDTLEANILVYESVISHEATEKPETEKLESRYDELTAEEIGLLAKVVWQEARGESAEGQQAVAEVVLNRVASNQFPDTLEEVVCQKGQFAAASKIGSAEPGEAQYQAIYSAMYGENILPVDVVFFATTPENNNLWGWIGNHAFCYAYNWEG